MGRPRGPAPEPAGSGIPELRGANRCTQRFREHHTAPKPAPTYASDSARRPPQAQVTGSDTSDVRAPTRSRPFLCVLQAADGSRNGASAVVVAAFAPMSTSPGTSVQTCGGQELLTDRRNAPHQQWSPNDGQHHHPHPDTGPRTRATNDEERNWNATPYNQERNPQGPTSTPRRAPRAPGQPTAAGPGPCKRNSMTLLSTSSPEAADPSPGPLGPS